MAEQRYESLLSAVDLAFPGHSAASRAKKAAATHLINEPERNLSSPVAQAVRHALGTSTTALGLPPFRQLLQQDPCFTVHAPQASEACIELNKAAVIKAASGNIRAAVDSIYSSSSSDAVTIVRRAAALFLAELPPLYRDKCARVAAAVDAAVGSPSKLGLNAKFKEIMAEDPCFKLTPSPFPSEVYLNMDVKQLVQLHLRQQAGRRGAPAAAPSALAAAAAAVPPPLPVQAATAWAVPRGATWAEAVSAAKPIYSASAGAAPVSTAATTPAQFEAVCKAFEAAALKLMPLAASQGFSPYPDSAASGQESDAVWHVDAEQPHWWSLEKQQEHVIGQQQQDSLAQVAHS